jgi:hypothetical protein
MKPNIAIPAALWAATLCFPAFAEEAATKPDSPPAQTTGPQMGGGSMMGNMGDMMMSEERLKKKQEFQLKMHELSGKILAATDATERDRLKAEQLQLMKDHEKEHHMMMMQMMQRKGGGMPGMGGGKPGMGGMQHGAAPAAPPATPTQQH